MINLEEIARKLDNILNGTDADIPVGLTSPSNANYFFKVYSEGLYLSKLNDMNTGKNFIPVVVGAYGGENNPVAGLGEQDRNVMVQILFPVRFKIDMYALEEYLDEVFVGRQLAFGSQNAICNLSPAQFGELQDFNFDEFKHWIENTYLQPVQVSEVYMVMNFTIYLSTAKDVGKVNGFVYGNEYSYKLSIGTLANVTSGTFSAGFTDDTPVFVENNDIMESNPASQQLLGQKYSKSLSNTTAFSKTITIYYKNNSSYTWLLNKYLTRDIQGIVAKVSEKYLSTDTYTDRYYYVSSIGISAKKGELLTITIGLGDLLEV